MLNALSSITALPGFSKLVNQFIGSESYPFGHHAASNAALNMMVRVVALDLEEQGVNVLLVHPGTVATEVSSAKAGQNGAITVDESVETVLKVVASAQIGKGQEIIRSQDGSVIPCTQSQVMSTSYLIIGANRGIGFGFIRQLALRPNTTVYASYRTAAKSTELIDFSRAHENVVLLSLDMTDEKSVKQAANELKRHTASIDVAIFNAGVQSYLGDVLETPPSVYLQHYEQNVVGPLILTQAFVPFLLASQSARRALVYLSTAAGSISSLPAINGTVTSMYDAKSYPVGHYATSKAALNTLGRVVALELERKGVSVLLVHPGMVSTDLSAMQVGQNGAVSVEHSVRTMLQVIESAPLGKGQEGILKQDGSIIAW
ncbi:uncharacterized protein L969DRAFT_94792 [Mixia osmundae IAM 14324]|uniref:Ketoreductase (KR) domain-containing protein n=1 Tax=Mixia osmundae (strain CBS 9802 / IAM 14324 / JCM 22182 / KY 12970) TaxID=764103 RepID=G7E491_MIXOS|nr:uncharacterized protein L969DRAFT_94792 [Mixia osmundae IAM 14324]KEI39747.1 hypothetical protein L969DRAFT_94792 [Mixia osmundae IAM 14324]GAA97651.1 hypothetical protein E5Q_04329 [Mixia osmundae IAM 14324]